MGKADVQLKLRSAGPVPKPASRDDGIASPPLDLPAGQEAAEGSASALSHRGYLVASTWR